MHGIKFRIIDVSFKTVMVLTILGIYQKISSFVYYTFDFKPGLVDGLKIFGSYFLGLTLLLGVVIAISLAFILTVCIITFFKEIYLYITTGFFDFGDSFESSMYFDISYWYISLIEFVDRKTTKKLIKK